MERDLKERRERVEQLKGCSQCGECQARCPHDLPIMEIVDSMVPVMQDMIAAYEHMLAQ